MVTTLQIMGHGGTGRSRLGPIPTNTRSRRHQGGHGVVTAPQILGHGGTGAATTLRHTWWKDLKQNTHAIKVSFVGDWPSLFCPNCKTLKKNQPRNCMYVLEAAQYCFVDCSTLIILSIDRRDTLFRAPFIRIHK